ncbi:MAG TPA: hypothetical protein VHQ90_00495 [Thermoanaerobaculia bacterium]|nr:hypothetical protein [Thermoanaerobaculia bacterium]
MTSRLGAPPYGVFSSRRKPEWGLPAMARGFRYLALFALLTGAGASLSVAGLLAALDRPVSDWNLRLLSRC